MQAARDARREPSVCGLVRGIEVLEIELPTDVFVAFRNLRQIGCGARLRFGVVQQRCATTRSKPELVTSGMRGNAGAPCHLQRLCGEFAVQRACTVELIALRSQQRDGVRVRLERRHAQ